MGDVCTQTEKSVRDCSEFDTFKVQYFYSKEHLTSALGHPYNRVKGVFLFQILESQYYGFILVLSLWIVVRFVRQLQLVLAGKFLWKSRHSTGLGSVSEVGRFTGAYEIVCIKHAGPIFDYMP